MKKKKVLLIAYNNLGKGGIQNQLMGIIRTLKDKVDFDVVIWDNKRDYYRKKIEGYVNIIECFRSTGKTTIRKKMDAFIRYYDIKKIISHVIEEYGPYDAIHCNNAFDAAPCLEAAYEKGIPVRISHAHNTENPSLSKKIIYPAYKVLYEHHRKKIRKYATCMIGCSKQVIDYFFGKDIGQVVHIGIDFSNFSNLKFSKKNKEIIELLHVGNMSEQKNQLFLIEVLSELIKLRKDVHLTLIGGGEAYLSKVEKLISEKNLAPYVDIKSPETNVPKAMSEADLFVFPSTFEGFGIVLIEAQSVGLKCIASDIVTTEANCGGIEYIPLEKGAVYWANILNEQIESGIKRENSYNVSEFTVENMGEQIYQVYNKVNAL